MTEKYFDSELNELAYFKFLNLRKEILTFKTKLFSKK